MGTEWVIPVLGLPFFGGLIVLIFVAFRGRSANADEPMLGLGRRRIAAGYLGALVLAFCVSIWLMLGRLRWGLQSGNYPKDAAAAYATELLAFYFIVLGTTVTFVMTVLGLPLVAGLRRIGFASMLGVGMASAIVGAFIGWLSGGPLLEVAGVCFLVAIGFALGARLPSMRSRPIQANISLERMRDL